MRAPSVHLALALLVALFAAPWSTAEEPRPRVGLVLGGGGARGGAHLGVLRVLEELRIPVDSLAGTSMGSLVGALYCEGFSPEEIERVVAEIPWGETFQDAPARDLLSFRMKQDDYLALFPFELGVGKDGISAKSGAITGTKLDFIFRSLTLEASGAGSFDRLRIPYRAVAMDLRTGDMVVLDHGDLAQAMRASMSVPGVFTPVEIEGRVLVDGGMARNIPVDVARAMGAERVIAIDVGTPPKEKVHDLSPVGVLSQAMAVLSERNRQDSREEIGPGDLLITPDLGDFSAGDFEHIADAIAAGEAAARAHEADLRRFSVSEEEYAAFLRRQRRDPGGAYPSQRVDSVAIEGVRRVPLEVVQRKIETRPGQILDLKTLSEDIFRIWQLGDFDGVGYRIEPVDGKNRLVIEAREKSWGPGYLRFGLAIRTDFEGESSFRLLGYFRRPNVNRQGGEWKTVAAFGDPLEMVTEFYQPFRPGGPWFVAPRLSWRRERAETFLVNGDFEVLKTTESRAGLDLGLQLKNYGEIRVGALTGSNSYKPTTTTTFAQEDVEVGGPRLRIDFDLLDDPFFPTQGNRTMLEAFLSRDSFGADDAYDTLWVETLHARTVRRNTFLGALELGTDLGSTLPFYAQFELGGFMRLSGLNRGEIRGDVEALFTLADYWEVKELGALGTFYAGAALQAGNAWLHEEDVSLGDLEYSGTLFVGLSTQMSPVFLGFGLAEGGRTAGYLVVGRAF